MADLFHEALLTRSVFALANLLEVGKIVLSELNTALPARIVLADLRGAQLHAPDLAGYGLRQVFDELYPPDALERGELLSQVAKHVVRQLPGRRLARDQRNKCLGDGQPDRIRSRNDAGLGDRRMLDQHALEFEWADPVV